MFFSRLTLLNKLLEDGNTLYRKHKLVEASHRYSYANKKVPTENQGSHQKVFDQLKTHLLINLSRCKRKMKDHSEAVRLAGEVVRLRPHCYQAYHARAQANHAAGNLHAALTDLTEAVRVAPQNRELHKILLNLKDEIESKSSPLPDSAFEESRDGSHDSTSGVGSSAEGSTKDYDPDAILML